MATVCSIAAALPAYPARMPRSSASRDSAAPPANASQNVPDGATRAAKNDTAATCARPTAVAIS
jgi:hypothetical protein